MNYNMSTWVGWSEDLVLRLRASTDAELDTTICPNVPDHKANGLSRISLFRNRHCGLCSKPGRELHCVCSRKEIPASSTTCSNCYT